MKVTCVKCGKEVEKRGYVQHYRHCKGVIDEVEPKPESNPEIDRLADFLLKRNEYAIGNESAVDVAIRLLSAPLSIPLSACPPELAYLRENYQYFLNVAGRKLGDRFVIEEVKMRR